MGGGEIGCPYTFFTPTLALPRLTGRGQELQQEAHSPTSTLTCCSRREGPVMIRTFGHFIAHKDDQGEHLKIVFSPTALPIQQRWRNNGLSADFLADYLTTFFPGDDRAVAARHVELKSAVSYVAN